MEKREEFNAALKEGLKNKDQVGTSTIRLILAALKDRDISARGQGKQMIDESEIMSMLQSMIKQRKESVDIYKKAGRQDLAAREEEEIGIIERFLPQQMEESEVDAVIAALIQETGAKDIKDMGRVMAELKTKYAGKMDMGRASGLVKAKLS